MKKEWFATWFDSPYYHTLYKSHDETDARLALDGLLGALTLPPGARLLDLACGKGRHARYLAEKGYDVTGLDISEASITYARHFEHEHLHFYRHDMRQPFRSNYFDAVGNFFTSFGYFADDRDHLATLRSVALNLKPGGCFLMDYFNSSWVRANLKHSEKKEIDGIEFHLKKNTRGKFVYKTVEFETGGRRFVFRERVRLFTLPELESLFEQAGLRLRKTYGDYHLAPFDVAQSQRLILFAVKV